MRITTKLFLSLCLIVGLGAALTSNAQIESNITIKADVPHSFVVNNTTLPAGSYAVRVADDYQDLTTLEIQSANGKTTVFFDTEPVSLARAMRNSELVFDKIGDTYFLSRVFLSGDESGNQLLKSKRQRRLEESGSTAKSESIAATRIQAKPPKQTVKKMD